MPKPQKKDLSERITDRMREIAASADPWDSEQMLRAQARAAQEEAATLILAMATSLSEACVRLNHRGAVKATEKSPAVPCLRCRTKVKHYREIADLVANT